MMIFLTTFYELWFSRKAVLWVRVSQNGHFFTKNVEKITPQNHENCVLLRENAFWEKWQSGRINFFWGGFPTFMVYALPLIKPARLLAGVVVVSPQLHAASRLASPSTPKKKINIIYIVTTVIFLLFVVYHAHVYHMW